MAAPGSPAPGDSPLFALQGERLLRVLLWLVWPTLLPVAALADYPEVSVPGLVGRPPLDVPALVLRCERMEFLVFKPRGLATNGAVLYRGVIVRDERREDLEMAAKRLSAGHPVSAGGRSLGLGAPMAKFYLKDRCRLTLWPFEDRVICSGADQGIDLVFGRAGVAELRTFFDQLRAACEPPQASPDLRSISTSSPSSGEQPSRISDCPYAFPEISREHRDRIVSAARTRLGIPVAVQGPYSTAILDWIGKNGDRTEDGSHARRADFAKASTIESLDAQISLGREVYFYSWLETPRSEITMGGGCGYIVFDGETVVEVIDLMTI